MSVDKINTTRTARSRPTRTPIGVRNRLTVRNKKDGFTYRIVNDVEDRVLQFQEAGYEVVTDDAEIGDVRLNDPKQEGSVVTKSVGNGVKAVLMRIPDEWYREDQQAKQEFVNKTEQAIKTKSDGQYGSINTDFK